MARREGKMETIRRRRQHPSFAVYVNKRERTILDLLALHRNVKRLHFDPAEYVKYDKVWLKIVGAESTAAKKYN